MKTKTTPTITYTEILSRAIRTIEEDIEDWHRKGECLPPEQRDMMISAGTKELKEKLEALKTLYRIETGSDI